MDIFHILFNPHAGGGTGANETKKLNGLLSDSKLIFHDMTKISDYKEFFGSIASEDKVIVSGGDGTLNRFINDTYDVSYENEIWYYASGSGNDFLHDLGMQKGASPFPIDKYIEKLPEVTVKGKTYRFINGIGYGIDGYCCEEGDRQRARSTKPVNYTKIAIMGLLFHYRRTNARVTIDGVTKEYKKVWLAPAMNGRFYGGGMMMAPSQNRLADDRSLTVVVAHDVSSLHLLTIFPSIFKGEHIKYEKYIDVLKGKHIKVEFDRPVSAQIDGETVTDVKEYEAFTYEYAEKKTKEKVNG